MIETNAPSPSEKPRLEVEKISLVDFLSYNNPNLPTYQKLIRREHEAGGMHYPQAFSELWLDTYFDRFAEGNEKFEPFEEKK